MTKKKQIGYDCSCCDFAENLPNKDLKHDFVFCCNPDCEFHYQVLFEHFRCKGRKKEKQKVYKPVSFGDNNMLPGDLSRLPDDCFSKETFVFIDSGFLSKLSNYFGKGKYLVYDIIKFSENISEKVNLRCKQIFYYTAPPFQSNNPAKREVMRKERYDRFTRKLRQQNVLVREGRCQRIKTDNEFVYKQKAVDSLMIMDLMKVPIDCPKIKEIVLIASDSDFVPIIKYLKEKGVNVILFTHYSKKRQSNFSRSNFLLKSVSRYAEITKEDFEKAGFIKKRNKKGR